MRSDFKMRSSAKKIYTHNEKNIKHTGSSNNNNHHTPSKKGRKTKIAITTNILFTYLQFEIAILKN